MITRYDQCAVQHVYRETNGVAHQLALMGQYNTWGLQIFEVMPECVAAHIFNDCNMYATVRVVP